MNISTIDIDTARVRTLPLFDNAKNINPQYAPDGRSIYFISNPEGVAEQWKHTYSFSFGGGQTTAAAESKDGKNVSAAVVSEPHKITIDLFANLAQFVYDDSNPEDPVGPRAVCSQST